MTLRRIASRVTTSFATVALMAGCNGRIGAPTPAEAAASFQGCMTNALYPGTAKFVDWYAKMPGSAMIQDYFTYDMPGSGKLDKNIMVGSLLHSGRGKPTDGEVYLAFRKSDPSSQKVVAAQQAALECLRSTEIVTNTGVSTILPPPPPPPEYSPPPVPR